MKHFMLLSMIYFLTLPLVQAQNYRSYRNDDYEKVLKTDSVAKKNIRSSEIHFEQYFKREYVIYKKIEPVTLPLVFNLVVAEDRQISYQQVAAQLEALNRAFSNKIGMPHDDFFTKDAVDTEIRFCIPEFSPKYIRELKVKKGEKISDFFSMKDNVKGIKAFQPEKHINIWVVDMPDLQKETQSFTSGGFAQLPFRQSESDGIVIDVDLFGPQKDNPLYSQGYTLVHLMGIYLGLKPLTGFYDDAGDGVDDTPENNIETLLCLPQREDYYVSTGTTGQQRRMTRNFMDNVPDDCAAMFTYGQKVRMHAVLSEKGPRNVLKMNENEPCDQLTQRSKDQDDLTKFKIPDFKLYPNPTSNVLTIEYNRESLSKDETENLSYDVFDFTGRKMSFGNLENKMEINVSSWPNGIYFFVLRNGHTIESQIFEVIR
jgi:Secretion system C-terminal sorting domain/Pregnancy-associated plasma protein-A